MSDGLTLFPVNRNNSDLYLVMQFTHSHTTCTERAQRDVIYRPVMYACPAKLPGPKETSGTEKDTSVFSLSSHPIPLCILPVTYITWASDELRVALIFEALTYTLCDPEVGWPVSSNYSEMSKTEGMIHALASGTLFYSSNIYRYIREVREFLKIPFLFKIDR